MHEAIQDARSNSGCARILNCFMHLGMLEAISIKMEIVSGNLRCRSISNCGFPAPDGEGPLLLHDPLERHLRGRDAVRRRHRLDLGDRQDRAVPAREEPFGPPQRGE